MTSVENDQEVKVTSPVTVHAMRTPDELTDTAKRVFEVLVNLGAALAGASLLALVAGETYFFGFAHGLDAGWVDETIGYGERLRYGGTMVGLPAMLTFVLCLNVLKGVIGERTLFFAFLGSSALAVAMLSADIHGHLPPMWEVASRVGALGGFTTFVSVGLTLMFTKPAPDDRRGVHLLMSVFFLLLVTVFAPAWFGQLTARRLADVEQSDASAVRLVSGSVQPWRLIRSSESQLIIGLLSSNGVAPVLKVAEWKDVDRIVPWSREQNAEGRPVP